MFTYSEIRLEKYMLKHKRKEKTYKTGTSGDEGRCLKIK